MRNDRPSETIEEHKEYLYCMRCGKRLRSEEAKQRGMGKVCFEKSKREQEKMQKLF